MLRYFGAFFILLTDILLTYYLPFLFKQIVDGLSSGNITGITSGFVLCWGAVWTLSTTCRYLQSLIFFPVVNETIKTITFKVVNHLHRIFYKEYSTLSTPKIISFMKRISQSARTFVNVIFLKCGPVLIKLGIAFWFVFSIHPYGIVITIPFIIFIFLFYSSLKSFLVAKKEAWDITDGVTLSIGDSIVNTRLVRHFHLFEEERLGEGLEVELDAWEKVNRRLNQIELIISIFFGVTLTISLFLALDRYQEDQLTVGDFVMLKGILLAAFLPMKTLCLELRQVSSAVINIERILEILDRPIDPISNNEKILKVDPFQGIVLENVSFFYNPSTCVLRDVNLKIPYGKKVVIVGESGSGKSSFCHVLAGLHSTQQGRVLIAGNPVREYPQAQLGSFLHFIPQGLQLFDGTLLQNLTYGVSHFTEKLLWKVLDQCCLKSLVCSLPLKWNTPVGERGYSLSEGQKQRLAIARALLIQPQYLILDETVHALDAENEGKILTTLFQQIPTVILISHRSSTLQYADFVIEVANQQINQFQVKSRLGDSY